ncbi:heparinase II/III family protein [Paenibacillus sp. UNC499MF]|uniref:heparinase II/III domain-containing protein n=1 Tax=Paenibacillus sp. UNC499MF TaxID=1502751 RepID=UPI0008A08FAB|nr:heparinase II/III family protein [Paenibacillus sp. UNC499MF]SEF69915.1 Alginate lyase [Paenibacillus sp. UNC499MF]
MPSGCDKEGPLLRVAPGEVSAQKEQSGTGRPAPVSEPLAPAQGSLRGKAVRFPWARETAKAVRDELNRLNAAGSLAIPQEPGGWWHQYVCPVHHTELLFDPAEAEASSFRCPYGCELEGEEYRGAWLVFKHQSLARAALEAAAVYAALRDESCARIGKELLVAYAEQFPLYPVHAGAQGWMLKGRAFHQALTEAIWSTTLLGAYLLLRDEGVTFSEKETEALGIFMGLLEQSMTEYRHILIRERQNAENNYTAWLNASLSCVYAAQGRKDALESLIEGEGGFRDHLSIGVNADGLEFEGSTYYHVFVLRAYLISARMAEMFGIDLYACQGRNGQSMRGMFEAMADLADDRGVLPALHDGPMERGPYAREIAEIAEQGLARYGIGGLRPILREAYRQLGGTLASPRARCGLEALLYGEDAQPDAAGDGADSTRGPRLWADTGFAVGRRAGNPLSFLADFGAHGGAHGHFDKLHLTVMHPAGTLTPDFGVVPYGSALRQAWYSETRSHNTVTLDGLSQAPHTGQCMRFEETEEALYAWFQSTGGYPGCTLDRHLLLTDGWLLDWFRVTAHDGGPRTAEWWVHPAAEPLLVPEEAGEAPGMEQPVLAGTFGDGDEGNPLLLAENLKEGLAGVPGVGLQLNGRPDLQAPAPAPAAMRLRYGLSGGESVYHTALVMPGDELLAVRTPGDSLDPSRLLTAIVHRHTGATADFVHVYRAGQAADIQWLAEGVVEVTAEEGATGETFARKVRLAGQAGLELVEPDRE